MKKVVSVLIGLIMASQPTFAADPPPADKPTAAGNQNVGVKPADSGSAVNKDESQTLTQESADLMTFAGACIQDPRGPEPNAAFLAALAAPLIGAGIDLLTSALSKAAADEINVRSTVVSIELAPKCIQIARGVKPVADDPNGAKLQAAIKAAPFAVEFFLRQSKLGEGLAIEPTFLKYGKTLDDDTSSRSRDLYATLTFSDPSAHTQTVSVPLGSHPTSSGLVTFDAMTTPAAGSKTYFAGRGVSAWIANPLLAKISEQKGDGAPANAAETPPADANRPQAPSEPTPPTGRGHAVARASQLSASSPVGQPSQLASGGFAPTPPPSVPPDGNRDAQMANISNLPKGLIPQGSLISPLSISVAITEVRKGNAVAKAFASVLGDVKQPIMDSVDPAKIQAAQAAAMTANNTFITSVQSYSTQLANYCTTKTAASAVLLYATQLALLQSAQAAHQAAPFASVINPVTRANAPC